MDYILRYNDSHRHSIPVGITTLSNTMYKQINTQAGYNIADSQPIKTYSKMFQPFKVRLELNRDSLCYSICIGFAVLIILNRFPVDIARNKQV